MDHIQLSEEDLVQQIKARNIIDRDTVLFNIGSLLSMIAFLFFVVLVRNLPGFLYMLVLIVLMISLWMITVWRQWSTLLEVGIKCPNCHKPLAEKINWLKIPGHNCPHCGRVALFSTEYLVDVVNQLKPSDH